MVELLITLTLIGLVVSLSVSLMRPDAWMVSAQTSAVAADLGNLESAAMAYRSDKGDWPSSLSDAGFVPAYVFAPRVPDGFDRSYGVGGYLLGETVGEAVGNNGHRICMRFVPDSASDIAWRVAKSVSEDMAVSRSFVASSCGAVADEPFSAGADTFVTYWLYRN